MAEISSRGTNKWLVRVFLGRSEDGKKRHHSKVIHGNKKAAQKYALSIETKRDLGTLEKPVTLITHRVMVESLNDMVEASFENPVLEGVLLVLYRSLERLRRLLPSGKQVVGDDP